MMGSGFVRYSFINEGTCDVVLWMMRSVTKPHQLSLRLHTRRLHSVLWNLIKNPKRKRRVLVGITIGFVYLKPCRLQGRKTKIVGIVTFDLGAYRLDIKLFVDPFRNFGLNQRRVELELELELIQTQMTQKPMLRAEVGMRVRCANKTSAE